MIRDPYAARASRVPQGLRSWLRLGGALGDTFRVADGITLMDGAATGATIAALLGIVCGSVLPMAPIGGGVLGILGGGFVGWALDLWVRQERARKSEKARLQRLGCVVHVECTDNKEVRGAKAALKEADAVLISVVHQTLSIGAYGRRRMLRRWRPTSRAITQTCSSGCLSKSNRKGISMNQPNLIIAAPWDYVPTTGAVASLLTTLERVGLVTGDPNTETPEGPSGRHGTTWTWSPGPTVAAALGAEYCEGVTLSVTDWLQPLFWPGGYECANGHRAHDLGNLALAMVATGTPPVHVCPVCGVSTSILDLGEYPIRFMGAHLWLRFDHASDPDSMTGPALETVRRILGLQRLECGLFDIAW